MSYRGETRQNSHVSELLSVDEQTQKIYAWLQRTGLHTDSLDIRVLETNIDIDTRLDEKELFLVLPQATGLGRPKVRVWTVESPFFKDTEITNFVFEAGYDFEDFNNRYNHTEQARMGLSGSKDGVAVAEPLSLGTISYAFQAGQQINEIRDLIVVNRYGYGLRLSDYMLTPKDINQSVLMHIQNVSFWNTYPNDCTDLLKSNGVSM